jgi:16S rRNA (adenine1518-N6/adenine1519-N6)-dimethyltransferase
MIQKEVAERIAAGPGSKTYGILSVLIQAWYKVEYLFTVHEHVFNPPPKVKSAVIRMTRNETTDLGCDEKLFKQIVKTTFNQRRKTLRNSIASILDKSHPLSADPIFNKRPEQLSVQEFVELDFESVAYLKENFAALEGHIIEDDFLKLKLENIFDGKPFVLTGNYPYNISSQIFFKMLDYKDLIPCCTGMIQKEVAERIAAGPGSKTYGILSVLIQAWYKVEYLFTVHEHVFNPPPKVKSAVIRMTRNETTDLGCDEKLFKQIVKTTFNQRRKTLRNSIASILDKSHPLSADPIFNKRPEQLSVQEFVELTNRVEAALAERHE